MDFSQKFYSKSYNLTNLMESFGHKTFISSQQVPSTGTGVLYPRVPDFLYLYTNFFKNFYLLFLFLIQHNFVKPIPNARFTIVGHSD